MSKEKENIVVLIRVRDFELEALTFNFDSEKWEKVESLNHRIYLVGGYNNTDEISSSVDVVDKHFQSTKASSMNIARADFGISKFDDRFTLVAGGYIGKNNNCNVYTKSCEIRDSFTDKWEKTSDLMISRGNFPLVYFNEKMLAIGGDSEKDGVLDSIESYDIKTKKWVTWSTKLLENRQYHGAIAFENKFYVFGGVHQRKICTSVEMYSLKTGQITLVTPIPIPIYIIGYCKRDRCIYLFGVSVLDDTTKHVQIYNTELDIWTTGVSLPCEVDIVTVFND